MHKLIHGCWLIHVLIHGCGLIHVLIHRCGLIHVLIHGCGLIHVLYRDVEEADAERDTEKWWARDGERRTRPLSARQESRPGVSRRTDTRQEGMRVCRRTARRIHVYIVYALVRRGGERDGGTEGRMEGLEED